MKILRLIDTKNKIKNMYSNMSNITTQKNKISSAPFHKIVLLNMKYDNFYNEKEFKIKSSITNDKKCKFLLSSLSSQNDISKDKKINTYNLAKELCNTINESISNNISLTKDNSYLIIDNFKSFFIRYIRKHLSMQTSYQGFFKIDIIINKLSCRNACDMGGVAFFLVVCRIIADFILVSD